MPFNLVNLKYPTIFANALMTSQGVIVTANSGMGTPVICDCDGTTAYCGATH